MQEPRLTTLKRLFAKSHNQCAFPKCELPIVESSGTVTGIVCHIKARNKGGPRFDPSQNQEQRHAFENLVLMCGRHSKIIDTDPKTYSADLLFEMKDLHEREGWLELPKGQGQSPERLLEEYRIVYIDAKESFTINQPGNVVVNTPKPPKFVPQGVLQADPDRRGYIAYLVKRYHKFAKEDHVGYKYVVVHTCIERDFGKKIDLIALDKFDDLSDYLKAFIDNTRAGKANCRDGIRSYRGFEEWLADCENAPRSKRKKRP